MKKMIVLGCVLVMGIGSVAFGMGKAPVAAPSADNKPVVPEAKAPAAKEQMKATCGGPCAGSCGCEGKKVNKGCICETAVKKTAEEKAACAGGVCPLGEVKAAAPAVKCPACTAEAKCAACAAKEKAACEGGVCPLTAKPGCCD